MGEIRDWAINAGSNNFSTAEGGMPEGMDYRDVNNAARERMAALKRRVKDIDGSLTAVGGPTAYTLTPNASTIPIGGGVPTFFDGQHYAFRADVASTGACTLAVDGGSPYPIYNNTGQPAGAGDIRGGLNTIHFVYLIIIGSPRWILTNAVSSDVELRNVNEVSLAALRVWGDLYAKASLEVGTDDGVYRRETGFPISIGDESGTAANGEPADKNAARRLAIAFAHDFSNLAAYLGFRSLAGTASKDFRIHNNATEGRVVASVTNAANATLDAITASYRSVAAAVAGVTSFEVSDILTLLRGPTDEGSPTIIQSDSSGTEFGDDTADTILRGFELGIWARSARRIVFGNNLGRMFFQGGGTAVTISDTTEGVTLHGSGGSAFYRFLEDTMLLATSVGDIIEATLTALRMSSPSGNAEITLSDTSGQGVDISGDRISLNNLPSTDVVVSRAASGGSYTIQASDLGKVVTLTGTTSTDAEGPYYGVTVPSGTSLGASAGDRIVLTGYRMLGGSIPGGEISANSSRQILWSGSQWLVV